MSVTADGAGRLADLMRTSLVVLPAETPFLEARAALERCRAPVARVVGTAIEGYVTAQDLEQVALAHRDDDQWIRELTVAHVMTRPAVRLPADAAVALAQRLLEDFDVRCVFIECCGAVVGYMTVDDVLPKP